MNLAEQNLQTIRNRISTIMEQLRQHQEYVESKAISTKSLEDTHDLSKEPEFGAEILAKYGLRSLYMRLKTIFWLPYEIWNKF